MKRADVIVIGAGPSGLRAAGRLAAAGLDVRVLEKKPRVGENIVCTGIVGRQVFEGFGLGREAVVEELRTVSPKVTGTPVQLLEYTSLLRNSYVEAAWYALAAIFVLVLFHFQIGRRRRSLRFRIHHTNIHFTIQACRQCLHTLQKCKSINLRESSGWIGHFWSIICKSTKRHSTLSKVVYQCDR